MRARCNASALSPLLTDDAAAVDFDAPFEAATLTAGASPTLSRKETSARGSFFEATALTSAVFAAVPVLAELTEDVVEDDVVEDVFAVVAVVLLPDLLVEEVADCAVFLTLLASFCNVELTPASSPLIPAFSRSTSA